MHYSCKRRTQTKTTRSQDENRQPHQRQRVRGENELPQRKGTPHACHPYIGLNPQPQPEQNQNKTGYYNLPESFWFFPSNRDALTLAQATHAAITHVFATYPQIEMATQRINQQLACHEQAWNDGIRRRYTSEVSCRGRHDPQYDNWDDTEEYL